MTGSAREVMKAELEWHGVEPAATLAGQLDKALTRAGFAIEKAIYPDPPQARCAFSIIELLELIRSLLRSQIREERINSIEELYSFLGEVDTHLALLSAARQQEAQDDGKG